MSTDGRGYGLKRSVAFQSPIRAADGTAQQQVPPSTDRSTVLVCAAGARALLRHHRGCHIRAGEDVRARGDPGRGMIWGRNDAGARMWSHLASGVGHGSVRQQGLGCSAGAIRHLRACRLVQWVRIWSFRSRPLGASVDPEADLHNTHPSLSGKDDPSAGGGGDCGMVNGYQRTNSSIFNPRPGRGGGSMRRLSFFCDARRTIRRIVLKFCTAYGESFAQLLVKKIDRVMSGHGAMT